MTGFLASVTSMQEAEIALAGGADILDLKDPSRGALGALSAEVISACVAGIARRRIVSATAGDLPMEPDLVRNAVQRLAKCGVDIVKIGLFPGGDASACISALREETVRGTRLVAVMFADQSPDFSLDRVAARCRLRRRDAGHGGQIRGRTAASSGRRRPCRFCRVREDLWLDERPRRFIATGGCCAACCLRPGLSRFSRRHLRSWPPIGFKPGTPSRCP